MAAADARAETSPLSQGACCRVCFRSEICAAATLTSPSRPRAATSCASPSTTLPSPCEWATHPRPRLRPAGVSVGGAVTDTNRGSLVGSSSRLKQAVVSVGEASRSVWAHCLNLWHARGLGQSLEAPRDRQGAVLAGLPADQRAKIVVIRSVPASRLSRSRREPASSLRRMPELVSSTHSAKNRSRRANLQERARPGASSFTMRSCCRCGGASSLF
jgi:hypothetical protein